MPKPFGYFVNLPKGQISAEPGADDANKNELLAFLKNEELTKQYAEKEGVERIDAGSQTIEEIFLIDLPNGIFKADTPEQHKALMKNLQSMKDAELLRPLATKVLQPAVAVAAPSAQTIVQVVSPLQQQLGVQDVLGYDKELRKMEEIKSLYHAGLALTLSQANETYLGKVKLIYVDPPYNTGNDFIYKDDFAENTDDFLKRSNQKDEAGTVLETMVDSAVQVPAPTDEECQRYYDARRNQYVVGQAVHLRHILFAVTPGVNVQALSVHADKALISLLGRDVPVDLFGKLAGELSNCPTSTQGGDLGWIGPQDCAPELASTLFFQTEVPVGLGVQPRLIHTRFGFHIIDVLERRDGKALAFDEVRERVAAQLAMQSRAKALHQYMSLLVGQALVEGIELDAADSPLVQ